MQDWIFQMIFLGIDPGIQGGIVVLCDDHFDVEPIAYPMPVDGTGAHGYLIHSIVDIIIEAQPDQIVIEKVTRPASLVRCMGIFEGIGAALDIDVITVTPQVWKKHFNLSKNKQESIDLALRIYPELKEYIKKSSDDGIAEAALIAEYGRLAPYNIPF